MFDKKRIEEYRELVHSTVKNVTWIGTMISDDRKFINIQLRFGSQVTVIPVSIRDIVKNHCSCKKFFNLIVSPLENVLKLYAEKETVNANQRRNTPGLERVRQN